MPFSYIEVPPKEVNLDTDDPVYKKARRTIIYEITSTIIVCSFICWVLADEAIRRSNKTELSGVYRIVLVWFLVWFLVRGLLGLRVFLRLNTRSFKMLLRVDSCRIVEEYTFGLINRTVTRRQLSKNVKTVALFYNQLSLTGPDNWSIVLRYDLFGSREKMRSYAEAVCEKAGIELQVVEGVA